MRASSARRASSSAWRSASKAASSWATRSSKAWLIRLLRRVSRSVGSAGAAALSVSTGASSFFSAFGFIKPKAFLIGAVGSVFFAAGFLNARVAFSIFAVTRSLAVSFFCSANSRLAFAISIFGGSAKASLISIRAAKGSSSASAEILGSSF